MLKRLVKEATSGFSSSGEQNSKRKKTPRKARNSTSEEDEEDTKGKQKSRAKNKSSHKDAEETTDQDDDKRRRREETPTEDESAIRRGKSGKNDATRRKKASRMKREPLLELHVIETVHSAMHGKKKKRARQELLDLFATYDTDDTGSVDADKFKKCIAKVGIKIKRSDDVDALVRCFTKHGGSKNDDESSSEANVKASAKAKASVIVDYVAFIDFACNARDSEMLSAIAEKLRETIGVYDDKHDRTTSVPYNIASDLKRLDKNKRGWIASDRFAEFMEDHQRPTFRLTVKEVATLTERFEYEYEKGTLGFDYQQFAQWLQPMLHLDKKQLHARVKRLVEAAQDTGGWELGEVFEAMDDDGDGHVSAVELKKALLEMGLPLTDAQIQCLVEEYDVDGDGKIQYEEFVSLFQAPVRKKKPQKSKQRESDGSESERTAKRRAKAKANVRNTFSWAINKAFARKHAAQAGKQQGSSQTKRQHSSDESSEEDTPKAKRDAKKKATKREAESSSETEEATSREKKSGMKKKKGARTSSEEDNPSSDSDRGRRNKNRKESTSRKKRKEVSTESESEDVRHASPRRKRAESTKSKKKNDDDDDTTDVGRKKTNKKEPKSVKKGEEDDSSEALKRNHRSLSTVSRHSRRDSATRSRATRHESTTRASPRRQSIQRSRSRKPELRRERRPSSRTGRSATRRRKHDSEDSSAPNNRDSSDGSSQSGLDLSQVRDLQKKPRKKSTHQHGSGNQPGSDGDDDDDDDDDESDNDFDDEDGIDDSKSDREYEKHLKKALRRAFDFFDLDHSSTIEKRELVHALRALGHEFSSKELDREMRRVDLDRTGALDYHEFVQFVKKQLSEKAYLLSKQREMEIRQAFQLQDTDKNGYLDEKEFEYLIYKVLQVELSVEEQDALLDFVDTNGDGVINEDEFIAFMKAMEGFHKQGAISKKKQRKMLDRLDGVSKLACSAMKKLVRGAPIDLDKNLLMFFGIPSNFRPALTSAAVCRTLHENSMEHALSFPCPETIVALAQDPTRVGVKKDSSMLSLVRMTGDADDEEANELLLQAESWQAHAIVSLKRATGIPKPYDTREDDVVKRCVHVCMYQEHDDTDGVKRRRHQGPVKRMRHTTSEGTIVGNVLEVPVYWNPQEEDVWEFSRKTTKENKYKFLVRTNNVNDRLFLLVEYVVHLRVTSDHKRKNSNHSKNYAASNEIREMAACWCKIPLRTLLAKRLEVYRGQEKLWGGTVQSPIDIEQDEILRRRTGWRAITNAFKKPTPPAMGVKSAPIESCPEEIQGFVRKMPPLIIAPFVSLPIVAEYMAAMQGSLWLKYQTSSATLCEPVLKLLPQIVDDHEALSVFRRAFDTEMGNLKGQEDRQLKFQDLVLRMWPSFLELLDRIPSTLLQDAQATAASTRRLSLLSPTAPKPPASGTTNERPADHQARSSLLQCTAQGKLRLRDVPVAAAPFHVREVTFDRLI